jgi:ABC-type uncharacterized transport system substrate-binding protein
VRRREFIVSIGAAAVWPALARTQQPTAPVIGFLSGRSPDESKHLVAAFHQGLSEAGFAEGKNVAVEYRWALGQYDRLPALAADLVKRRVAVLAAVGGDSSALAAKQATSTIPVVFGMPGDPVKAGIVESLSRPGGNVTGFTVLNNELEPKRLGMLHDLMPGPVVIGVLLNPNFPSAVGQLLALEKAAQTIGLRLTVFRASGIGREFDITPPARGQRAAGCSGPLPHHTARSARNKLPAIYPSHDYAVDGGLISYGPDIKNAYRQAGTYVGQILKGAKPADLPVLQPTKYEFVINLKTAKSLGRHARYQFALYCVGNVSFQISSLRRRHASEAFRKDDA